MNTTAEYLVSLISVHQIVRMVERVKMGYVIVLKDILVRLVKTLLPLSSMLLGTVCVRTVDVTVVDVNVTLAGEALIVAHLFALYRAPTEARAVLLKLAPVLQDFAVIIVI